MMEIGTAIKMTLNAIYIPFALFFAWTGVNMEAVYSLAVLVLADIGTGVWRELAMERKPRSRRLAGGLLSKLLFVLIPVVLAVAAKGIQLDISPLVYASIGVLILGEVYSIIGNIATITTGEEMPEFDALSLVLKKIRAYVDRFLDHE